MLPNKSKDGISVSSPGNCEDSSAFLEEETWAIVLKTSARFPLVAL